MSIAEQRHDSQPVTDDEDLDWLRRIAAFGDVFDAPGFEFGQWVPSRRQSNGVYTMPWFEFSAAALEFLAAGRLDPSFNWPEWMESEEGRRLADPAGVGEATAAQLVKLWTALIRSDRFTEGSLEGAYESGLLRAFIRRAAELSGSG